MFQTWNSSKWTWWYHCGKANALTTSPTAWGTKLYSQVFSYWPTVGWKYNRNKLVLFFSCLDFVGLPCVVACVCVCDLLFPQALTMHTPLHRANLLSLFLIWSIILCLFELFPHMFIHLWNILICHYHLDTPGYEHLNGSITANEVLVFCPVSFVRLSAWRQHSGPGGRKLRLHHPGLQLVQVQTLSLHRFTQRYADTCRARQQKERSTRRSNPERMFLKINIAHIIRRSDGPPYTAL